MLLRTPIHDIEIPSFDLISLGSLPTHRSLNRGGTGGLQFKSVGRGELRGDAGGLKAK